MQQISVQKLTRRAVLAGTAATAAPLPALSLVAFPDAEPDAFTWLLGRRAEVLTAWRNDPRDLDDAEVDQYGAHLRALEQAMADNPPSTKAGAIAALDFLISEAAATLGGAPIGEESTIGQELLSMLQAARDVLAGGAS